jgi:hypothetical protein
VLQAELDASKAAHSQQQARMQQVTDELLRQVWGKVWPSTRLVASRCCVLSGCTCSTCYVGRCALCCTGMKILSAAGKCC